MPVPMRLTPLPMARVWGGRRLADSYGKPLPDGPVGESWELVDRADAQSVVRGGPLDGTTLHELWRGHRALFGTSAAHHPAERFPLLIKLLDARDTLSVQVHPPAAVAAQLGGEPKTECWYLLDAAPGAQLYAGLRDGVDRAAFEAALEAGDAVEDLLHTLPVRAGDALLLPSGRVHAIGAGCLIAEVQQNSDTTYRVWDFDRPGLDGEPRELHVAQSLRSIDFDDHEPDKTPLPIETDLFRVAHRTLDGEATVATDERCAVAIVVDGAVACGAATFAPGETVLVPAGCPDPLTGAGELLQVTLP